MDLDLNSIRQCLELALQVADINLCRFCSAMSVARADIANAIMSERGPRCPENLVTWGLVWGKGNRK